MWKKTHLFEHFPSNPGQVFHLEQQAVSIFPAETLSASTAHHSWAQEPPWQCLPSISTIRSVCVCVCVCIWKQQLHLWNNKLLHPGGLWHWWSIASSRVLREAVHHHHLSTSKTQLWDDKARGTGINKAQEKQMTGKQLTGNLKDKVSNLISLFLAPSWQKEKSSATACRQFWLHV